MKHHTKALWRPGEWAGIIVQDRCYGTLGIIFLKERMHSSGKRLGSAEQS